MKKLSILLFLSLFFNSLFLNAGSRVALVIGNSDYDTSMGKLSNPKNDATDIGNALEKLGFNVVSVIDGNRKAMNNGINSFRNLITRDCDIAIFFYAGHGIQTNGKNYLIPLGENFTSEDDLESDAVNMDAISDRMVEAKNKILILDACRDNPLPKKTRSGTRGLAVMQTNNSDNTMIIYATSPGKVAQDGAGRNSPFTESLLKNINDNKIVEVLFKSVASEVREKTNGNQIPWFNSNITGDIYLSGTLKVTSNQVEKIETPNKIESVKETQTNVAVKTETPKVVSKEKVDNFNNMEEIIRGAENSLNNNNNEKSTAVGYYIDSNNKDLYFLFNPEDYSFKFNEIKNKSITIACDLNNWNLNDTKWKLNRDDSLGMWKLIVKKGSIPNGMQFKFVIDGVAQQPNKNKVPKQNLKEDFFGGINLIIRY